MLATAPIENIVAHGIFTVGMVGRFRRGAIYPEPGRNPPPLALVVAIAICAFPGRRRVSRA